MQATTTPQYVPRRMAQAALGISKATWFRRVRDGTLPQPIKMGPRCYRWDLDAVLRAARATTQPEAIAA